MPSLRGAVVSNIGRRATHRRHDREFIAPRRGRAPGHAGARHPRTRAAFDARLHTAEGELDELIHRTLQIVIHDHP
ncbi:MAG: hypothetical protein QOI64_2656, partial [Solirubrobacteraceae bacterium]|nr:hypothetical protein [Solirubrobacteraceae bacterium]